MKRFITKLKNMHIDETVEEKVERLNKESTDLEPYNKNYPSLFNEEKNVLLSLGFSSIIKRIEHFGSTAIPNISSKPIVDIMVEVSSLEDVIQNIVPVLKAKGYDYLWRPSTNMQPPWYAWFIKRNSQGTRTHHIHMIEENFQMWERLLFRDYLREFPEKATDYGDLKDRLSREFPSDRSAYTNGKSDFVTKLTAEAKAYYAK